MTCINRTKEKNLLKTARGQIDAALRMIEDDRYCIDISKQILATQSLLKKANLEILRKHMDHCVAEAFSSGSDDAKEEKITEIIGILDTYCR